MEQKFRTILIAILKKCRIQLILFVLCAIAASVSAVLGASATALGFLSTLCLIVSGAVCFFSILFLCTADYYRKANGPRPQGPVRPLAFLLRSVCVHLLLQLLIAAVFLFVSFLAPYGSDFKNAADAAGDNLPLVQEIYGQEAADAYEEQAQALSDLLEAIDQKGYTSLSFILSVLLNIAFSYVRFVITLYAAITFGQVIKGHPVLASIAGYFALTLLGNLIILLITNLSAAVAPGIQNFASQITSVSEMMNNLRVSSAAEFYQSLSAALPEASVYIKFILFTNLCGVVAMVTNLIIASALLAKKDRSIPTV